LTSITIPHNPIFVKGFCSTNFVNISNPSGAFVLSVSLDVF
jgi:hypothetical protein